MKRECFHLCTCIGFMWQCFGSRRAGGVASEQSLAGVPAAPKGKCLCQSVAMSNSVCSGRTDFRKGEILHNSS